MRKTAVLIIHGFMSSQNEVKYLRDTIKNKSNFDVYTFTLPGHDDYSFKNITYKDWITSSEMQLNELKSKYNNIYLIGHSMGGVIASYLAGNNKEIKKLVLVAPSFKYLEIFEDTKILKKTKLLKDKFSDTINNRKKYETLTQRILNSSIGAVVEFSKLVKEYQDSPKKIKCDILIVHGETDLVVPLKSSEYVFNSVKSDNKYLKIISDADHSVLYDNKKEKAAGYINNYLKGGLLWIITRDLKI